MLQLATILENKPLAKSLFEEVELDREVPETYYQAIAEVLAFVYNLKERDGKPVRWDSTSPMGVN